MSDKNTSVKTVWGVDYDKEYKEGASFSESD